MRAGRRGCILRCRALAQRRGFTAAAARSGGAWGPIDGSLRQASTTHGFAARARCVSEKNAYIVTISPHAGRMGPWGSLQQRTHMVEARRHVRLVSVARSSPAPPTSRGCRFFPATCGRWRTEEASGAAARVRGVGRWPRDGELPEGQAARTRPECPCQIPATWRGGPLCALRAQTWHFLDTRREVGALQLCSSAACHCRRARTPSVYRGCYTQGAGRASRRSTAGLPALTRPHRSRRR